MLIFCYSFGTVPISPLLFQDDIFSLSGTINAARSSLLKVDTVMKMKQLTLNKDKTAYVLFGNTSMQQNIRNELKSEPLMCGTFQVKEKESDKYLGEMFHRDGLSRSVEETIKSRAGKIKAVSWEIKAIVEDYRAEVVGGALCGVELWTMCALPSLLSSSSTWQEITPEAIEIAEQLQLDFLRMLFKVPKSCPRPALRSESGVLSIKYQIMIAKVSLVFHIRNMNDEALAKKIYIHQLKYGWPGLVRESIKICEELGIPDVTMVKATAKELKIMVKEACRIKDEKELKERINNMDKLEFIKKEDTRRKKYIENMTLSESRLMFQYRTRIIKNAGNYKNWGKFRDEGSKCKFCLLYDGSSHLMRCKAFEHLRGPEVCLEKDGDLVQYLRQVLHLREKKEQEQERVQKEQKEKE